MKYENSDCLRDLRSPIYPELSGARQLEPAGRSRLGARRARRGRLRFRAPVDRSPSGGPREPAITSRRWRNPRAGKEKIDEGSTHLTPLGCGLPVVVRIRVVRTASGAMEAGSGRASRARSKPARYQEVPEDEPPASSRGRSEVSDPQIPGNPPSNFRLSLCCDKSHALPPPTARTLRPVSEQPLLPKRRKRREAKGLPQSPPRSVRDGPTTS